MNKHYCKLDSPCSKAGEAIDYCVEDDDDGTLWAGNCEYDSQVNYCPVCGYKAKVQVTESK